MGFLGKAKGNKSGAQQDTLGSMSDLPLQAKLRYGQPDDAYEQEADRVADSVVNNSGRSRTPGASPAMAPAISNYVQRQGGEEEKDAARGEDMEKQKTKNEETGTTKKEEEKPVQMKGKEEEKPIQKKGEKKEEEKPVQKKGEKKDEEKPVQKKGEKKEEEKPVQKKGEKKEEEKPVQKKGEKKEEEKPVQKKSTDNKEEEKKIQKKEDTKKEEEKSVQKKGDKKEEEKPVQKKESKKEEEKPVQKKGEKEEDKPVQKEESNNPKAEEPDIEKQIMASKNGGRPMHDDTRKEMEKQFGKDFRGVKIHNDALSYELCRKINAQAFTHGNHIYFGEGKYSPESTEGKRLLAHELTHVVQQGYDVRKKMVQKADGDPTTHYKIETPTEAGAENVNTEIDIPGKRLIVPKLRIPTFKSRHPDAYGGEVTRPKGSRPDTNQVQNWKAAVAPNVGPIADSLISQATARGGVSQGTYFFKGKTTSSMYLIGNRETLVDKLSIPFWDKQGVVSNFQVDHRKEMQLGGQDSVDGSNYELLEASANGSSGSLIGGEVSRKIRAAIGALKKTPIAPQVTSLDATAVKETYDVTFKQVSFELNASGNPDSYWELSNVKSENEGPASKIEALTGPELEGLGNPSEPRLFTSVAGGNLLPVPTSFPRRDWMPRVDLQQIIYDSSNQISQLQVRAYYRRGSGRGREMIYNDNPDAGTWNVQQIPGVFGGGIEKESVLSSMRSSLRIPGMSPIELHTLELGANGIMARGKVLPTVPLIERADIDIIISGDDIQLRKEFSASDFNVPPPFRVSNAAIAVFFSTARGVGMEGRVDFGIQNVGEGFIEADATLSGINLTGQFDFDSSLFQPARVRVTYRNEQWTITGQIGIPQGKVRGIKRGTISITYENEILTATGEVEPDIKGIQRGNMNATFTADGFLISGEFTLSNEIPGIRGGNVSASLEKTGDEYKVRASGTAQPAIPGIDTQLSIEYDNGALKIEGEATYQRGILTGSIRLGATNRAVGADGEPTGDPTDTFIMYGGGEVTVRITPWLQGTVGVNFLPNGQMEVSGRIGIPSPIDVFPRKEIPERDLFSIGVDIPIFAIPLGPRSIGLKATIAGALKVYAGIGPGRLEQLELGITYNPDQPENTHITGDGQFVIPADAGLKLAVRASIGVDAGIAGVEGGIEVAGGLGLEATASAAISIDWTPGTGLELNADLSADVQPKFIFTIDGFIRAWVLFFEHEWRKRFVDYEYGSNLNFGVTLPIHYKEGEAFDISYEDIEFRKPDIDPTGFIGGLLRDIA